MDEGLQQSLAVVAVLEQVYRKYWAVVIEDAVVVVVVYFEMNYFEGFDLKIDNFAYDRYFYDLDVVLCYHDCHVFVCRLRFGLF